MAIQLRFMSSLASVAFVLALLVPAQVSTAHHLLAFNAYRLHAHAFLPLIFRRRLHATHWWS